MIDIFDIIHYLIGIIILVGLLWTIIQTHNYFSKDVSIENLINKND